MDAVGVDSGFEKLRKRRKRRKRRKKSVPMAAVGWILPERPKRRRDYKRRKSGFEKRRNKQRK